MSYILDALNKSEQERQSTQTPGLTSFHRQPLAKKSNAPHWSLILGTLVVVNAVGLYFWINKSESANKETIAQIQTEAKIENREEVLSSNTSISNTALSKQNTQTKQILTPSHAIPISELPRNIQSEIPDLQFSTHLFSEEASFRMVTINGQILKEGEYISSGLRLKEVTEEGVILSYKNYLVELSVLTTWQSQ